jgi:hypothetical protein
LVSCGFFLRRFLRTYIAFVLLLLLLLLKHTNMLLVGQSFKVWSCLYVVVATFVLLTMPSRAFTAIVKPCSSCSSSTSRIFSSAAGTTTELVNGLVKKVSQPGRGGPITLGDMATIKYSCYIPGQDKSPPFAKADRQKMVRNTEAAQWP